MVQQQWHIAALHFLRLRSEKFHSAIYQPNCDLQLVFLYYHTLMYRTATSATHNHYCTSHNLHATLCLQGALCSVHNEVGII